jgi:hypothetical protein
VNVSELKLTRNGHYVRSYIYIERESERERERGLDVLKGWSGRCNLPVVLTEPHMSLAILEIRYEHHDTGINSVWIMNVAVEWLIIMIYIMLVGNLKGPIHDQSCCATLCVVQHDWSCMVLIDSIVNGQTCVAQNNFAQHDWSCMGPFKEKDHLNDLGIDGRTILHRILER